MHAGVAVGSINVANPRMPTTAQAGAVAAVYFAAVAGCVLTGWPNRRAVDVVSVLAFPVLALVFVPLAALLAASARSRLRTTWALLTVGLAAWGATEAIWAYYDLTGAPQPVPAWSDATYLIFVSAMVTGLVLFPGARSWRAQGRTILDGVILTGSFFLIAWLAVLRSIWQQGGTVELRFAASLAYPSCDFLMLTIGFLVLLRVPSGLRVPLALLVAALASNALADSVWGYLSNADRCAAGSVSSIFNTGTALLIVVAMVAAHQHAESRGEKVDLSASPSGLALWLPLVPLVVAGLFVVPADPAVVLEAPVVVTLVVLVVATIIRQVLEAADAVRREQQVRELAQARELQYQADVRYRRLVDNSAVPTGLLGPDERLKVANQAMCDFFGYDINILRTKTRQELLAPDYLDADQEMVDDIVAGDIESYRIQKQYIHADGHLIWGDLSVSCVRRPDGGVADFIVQIVDVTPEKQARQQLAAMEERYRLLADNSVDVIAHVGQDGLVKWVSPSVESTFGAPPSHLIGKPALEFIAPPNVAEVALREQRVMGGAKEFSRTRSLDADGGWHWIEAHAKPFYDRGGQLDGYLVSIRLIDDIVAAEQDAASARRAEVEQEEESRRLADRLQDEIASAKDYVTSILPDDLHGEVEVTSRYLPAMDLGGDGFHYRWLDDDHLMIYLIDVSGHGIRPALLSVSVHNLVRSGSLPLSTLLNPERLLNKLNRDFPMDEQAETYFTIWYGVYQKSTRTLRYASAGHPPALVLTRQGDTVTATPLRTPGTPVGVVHETTYTADSYTVPPGGQLLIYSDGAYEFNTRTAPGTPMSLDDFTLTCTTLAARPDWSLDLLVDRLKALSPDGQFDDDCALILATVP